MAYKWCILLGSTTENVDFESYIEDKTREIIKFAKHNFAKKKNPAYIHRFVFKITIADF